MKTTIKTIINKNKYNSFINNSFTIFNNRSYINYVRLYNKKILLIKLILEFLYYVVVYL